jgi:hypothetical protein
LFPPYPPFLLPRYGAENVDCVMSSFQPLEWTVAHDNHEGTTCMAKIVIRTDQDKEVLGIHIAAPNAGEIIQGLAVAFRKGLTHRDLLGTVGIHPTTAEEFTTMKVLKVRSPPPPHPLLPPHSALVKRREHREERLLRLSPSEASDSRLLLLLLRRLTSCPPGRTGECAAAVVSCNLIGGSEGPPALWSSPCRHATPP